MNEEFYRWVVFGIGGLLNHTVYVINEPFSSREELERHSYLKVRRKEIGVNTQLTYILAPESAKNDVLFLSIQNEETDLTKAIYYDVRPFQFRIKGVYPFLDRIEDILKEECPDILPYMNKNEASLVQRELQKSQCGEIISAMNDMISFINEGVSSNTLPYSDQIRILVYLFIILCPRTKNIRDIILSRFKDTKMIPVLMNKFKQIKAQQLTRKYYLFDKDYMETVCIWDDFFKEFNP